MLHQVGIHDGPIRMGDLAERLLVANSSCNRIVARLVEAGLLERHRVECDRRVVTVALTTDGHRLRRRMAAVHTRDIDALFGSRLGGSELRRLDDILASLEDDSAPT